MDYGVHRKVGVTCGHTNSAHRHFDFRPCTHSWPRHRLQASSTKKHRKRVEATITQIQVEASTVNSWWIVTAEWSDPATSRALTFRSRRINFPPHYHIGERIVVNFDANQPKHYRMEL